MEEVVAEPLDGGGGGGSNTFTSTVEGADFVEGVYHIDTDMTGVVRLSAVDESGYNGIEIWFPPLPRESFRVVFANRLTPLPRESFPPTLVRDSIAFLLED